MSLIPCPRCGKKVSDSARKCPACGTSIRNSAVDSIPSSDQEEANSGASVSDLQPVSASVPEVEETYEAASDVRSNYPKPKRKSGMIVAIISVAVVLLLAVAAFFIYQSMKAQEEAEVWKATMQSPTISSLTDFMSRFPEGEFYATADSLLRSMKQADDEAWLQVESSLVPSAFRSYLERFPAGLHRTTALQKIDSLDWVVACRDNTEESYANYQIEHPDGLYVSEARQKAEKLEAQQLTAEEQEQIQYTMYSYYQAVQNNDENTLISFFDPVIAMYYGKKDATKSDVLLNQRKIFNGNILSMTISVNDNFTSSKDDEGNYHTSFPIDITYVHADTGEETYTSSIIEVVLNPNLKILSIQSEKVSSLKTE